MYPLRAMPLIVLATGSAVRAETITADSALKRYRSLFPSVAEVDCPRASDTIVVCGHSGPDPNRPPIPYQPQPGDTVRLLPGEPPRAGFAPLCTWDCVEPPKGGIGNIVKGI